MHKDLLNHLLEHCLLDHIIINYNNSPLEFWSISYVQCFKVGSLCTSEHTHKHTQYTRYARYDRILQRVKAEAFQNQYRLLSLVLIAYGCWNFPYYFCNENPKAKKKKKKTNFVPYKRALTAKQIQCKRKYFPSFQLKQKIGALCSVFMASEYVLYSTVEFIYERIKMRIYRKYLLSIQLNKINREQFTVKHTT